MHNDLQDLQNNEKKSEIALAAIHSSETKLVTESATLPAIICQIGLNKTDLVQSFEEIGWFNPDVDP